MEGSRVRLRSTAGSSRGAWRDDGLPWWGKPTETPAVFALERSAKDLVHESCTADTRDHEDHTFCGMMFDVRCQSKLPLDYLEISSVWVRGALGPMTVWTTDDTFMRKHEDRSAWRCLFSQTVPASPLELVELRLDSPLRLENGQSAGLYVHSATPGDEGLVYDDRHGDVTHEDAAFQVLPGLAHLSNRPFGRHGMWGRPWRPQREFVGRISYGVRWLMWKPSVHAQFPAQFRAVVRTLIMASRRRESPIYLLQDEVVLFILNKCMWSDFGLGDTEAGHPRKLSAAAAAGHLLQSAGEVFARLTGRASGSSADPSANNNGAGGSGRLAPRRIAPSTHAHSELRALLALLTARAGEASQPSALGGEDEEEDEEDEEEEDDGEGEEEEEEEGGDGEEDGDDGETEGCEEECEGEGEAHADGPMPACARAPPPC